MPSLRSLLPLIEISKAVKDRSLNPPSVPAPPRNYYLPQIYGIAELGNTIIGIPGFWRGFGALSYVWHWERDGVMISGSQNLTAYTYQPPDEFADITFVVTVTDSIGQTTTVASDPLILTNLIQLEDATALHYIVHTQWYNLSQGLSSDTSNESDFVTTTVSRMKPKFFTVDGPRSMSFALTTNGDNLRVDYVSRMKNDLVGVIWNSEDTKDHKSLRYSTKKDYRNMIWAFDLEVSPNAPTLDDPAKALTLTIEGRDSDGEAVTYFVALKNYASAPTTRSSRVTIDFNTVRSGFDADGEMYLGDVDRMFIGCILSDYDGLSSDPLDDGPTTGWMTISNSLVSGSNSTMVVGVGSVPQHSLGMSTAYDDHYDQSPERIIDNIYGLGYRDWINHYCGMSFYPEKRWNGTRLEMVDVGDPLGLVNSACKKWHSEFLKAANAKGYKVIQSVSFEMFSEHAVFTWTQRDWNDNFGETGYTPPSYLYSPCNVSAMAHLKSVFTEFATVASGASVPIYMQVGEPWWWTNVSTQKPCIYDTATRLAFNDATGLFMSDMGTVSSGPSGTTVDAMKIFLRDSLGKAVRDIRLAVKDAYPEAEVSVLPFLPTIVGNGYMEFINLPNTYYEHPNFEFFQTEAYDWIISGTGPDLAKLPQAMTYPITTLGYPPSKVQYLAGFAPTENTDEDNEQIWIRIFDNIVDNVLYGIAKQHIWSYVQVMRDSITYNEGLLTRSFLFGETYHSIQA